MFAPAESAVRTDDKEEKSAPPRSLARLLGEGSKDVKDSMRELDPQDFFS